MDMTHITEFTPTTELSIDHVFSLAVGAGGVDPDLIEPREPDPDVEELIAFRCSAL